MSVSALAPSRSLPNTAISKKIGEGLLLNSFNQFLGLRVRDVSKWGQTGIGGGRERTRFFKLILLKIP
jgi:hypothetical protein